MSHQTKVHQGSRSLCSCGCGRRKTSFRRRFASGCNGDKRDRSDAEGEKARRLRGNYPTARYLEQPAFKKEPRVAWKPEPTERYLAIVSKVFQDFYFAELSQGEQCFIGSNSVQGPQGHRCLILGDEVSVRLQRGTLNRSARWAAYECHLVTPREYPEVETGIVREWRESGTRGFVDRPCGCPIFVTVQIPDTFIREGDHVEVSSFALDKNRNKYFARAIRTIPEED